ncbi:hypothetical protein COOONC_10765 [Cooperia oncophora]
MNQPVHTKPKPLMTRRQIGYIYRLKEYERRFAPKYIYWIVFFILIAPTTLGSFLAYSKSKTKYEELARKKI